MATSIMDLFRSSPAKQQQQPTNGQPSNNQGQQPANGTQQAQQNANNGGNLNPQGPGTMPNQGQQPNSQGNNQNSNGQQQPTGIDKFAKMWDDNTSQPDVAPSFNLDPKDIASVAGGQDFMQGIDPELIKQATGGDVQALMKLMNNVAQNAYGKSLEHTSVLTDRFVGAREAHGAKTMGKNVRKELTTTALSSIPNFKNPVVKRQLAETADRFQKTHPDATAQEIVDMTLEYYQELSTAMGSTASNNGDGKKQPPKEERGEEYWNTFFDEAAAGED